jgi:hypothetical protein
MSLPAEVRVVESSDGVRFLFPPRRLGGARGIGCVPIAFGFVFMGLSTAFAAGSLETIHKNGCFAVGVALLTLPFYAASLAMIGLGFWLLIGGRCEVRLEGGRLTRIERFGAFHWSRSIPAGGIVRVMPLSAPPSRVMAGGVHVEDDRGKQFLLAVGYPPQWTRALAEELSRRSGRILAEPPTTPETPSPEPDAAPAPVTTDIRMEQLGEAVTLSIPAKGLKAGCFFFIFSSFWLTITAIVTTSMIVALAGKGRVGELLGALAFSSIFWTIGIAVLCAALIQAKRSWRIVRGPDGITVHRGGPFGVRVERCPAADVGSVAVEDSGWRVNNVIHYHIVVHSKGGEKIKLMRGRPMDELAWVAGLLRGRDTAMRIKAEPAKMEPEKGICQVCAGEMTENVVYCAKCGTPHHEDCWTYAGQCSTFGCAERVFRRNR